MSAFLTVTDVEHLTGAKRAAFQRRVLDKAGIRYVKRLDGSPALTWEAVNAVLAGNQPVTGDDEQPNLDFLNGPKAQRR
jgi:hypothetical protein